MDPHILGAEEALRDSIARIEAQMRMVRTTRRTLQPLYLLGRVQPEGPFERELRRYGERYGVPVQRYTVQSVEDWYEFREEVDYDLSGVLYTGCDRPVWWPQVLRAYPAVFDVDGVTTGTPAVVESVLRIMRSHGLDEEVAGQGVLVLGRSRYVGIPMAAEVCRRFDAVPTIAHSKMDPRELDPLIRGFKYVISCLPHGVALSAGHITEGSAVMDVAGSLEIPPGVEPWFRYTPSTGCIGPLTVHILLERALLH